MMWRTAVLCAAILGATASLAGAAVPAGGLVQPGDRIRVDVAGEADVSQDVVVASDGTIGFPLLGQGRVGGKTPANAVEAIAVALRPYVRDPHVSIDIASEGQIRVTVL